MRSVGLRSPCDKVGGLFYFGRLLDKIRAHAKGELPPDYEASIEKWFDEKCTSFLRVRHDQLVAWVNAGMTDEEILQSCFAWGQRPPEDEIYMWNEFNRKRGWNDEVSGLLRRRKIEKGMAARSEIETVFQFIDANEGRLPNTNHFGGTRRDEISLIVSGKHHRPLGQNSKARNFSNGNGVLSR